MINNFGLYHFYFNNTVNHIFVFFCCINMWKQPCGFLLSCSFCVLQLKLCRLALLLTASEDPLKVKWKIYYQKPLIQMIYLVCSVKSSLFSFVCYSYYHVGTSLVNWQAHNKNRTSVDQGQHKEKKQKQRRNSRKW